MMGSSKDEILLGLRGHLTWLADAGIVEIPAPPPAPGPAVPNRIPAAAPVRRSEAVAQLAADGPRLTLSQIREELGECTRCKLHTGRTKLVFGVGNPRAEIVFVGEGPGADEDLKGEPFVGKAGQLLDRMIHAMGFTRAEVYICNVVKCRPPGNRTPEPDEIETCSPFLAKQIESIRPRVLVSLGKVASQALLHDATPITRLRGRWREAFGVPLMPTFHPAYLLRSPGEKAKAWEDLKEVVRSLGRELPKK
jgi:uracil-DNA glycosylase family 4